MKLFALSCGHLTGRMRDMMEGGEGDVLLPISTYLIEHPKGRVMFDSGLHTACQSDPAGRLGATARLFGFHYTAGEEVGARLQSIDRDPARVDWLVNSHLHFDHCSGNAQLPNATVVVQRAELEAAKDPELAARTGLGRDDWATSRCGCGWIPARWCWRETPATSAARSPSGGCRASCTTARRCCSRSTAWPSCSAVARASSSGTTSSSGARCRRRRTRWSEAARSRRGGCPCLRYGDFRRHGSTQGKDGSPRGHQNGHRGRNASSKCPA